MAAVAAVRALLSLHQSVTLQHSFGHIPAQSPSTFLLRVFCSAPIDGNELKPPVDTENVSLLENLNLLGVDVKMARLRQPGVLRKASTNEQGLTRFLQGKGASRKVIAGIISRYPRAITRSIDHLAQRWDLWRDIFQKDEEIVSILDRSPESFFRTSDNGNLKKNIAFLTSLGLNAKDLHRLLTTAPRTFSNSLALNKQMVEFLEDIYAKLGGNNPEQFPRFVISRNLYILIRSTKRVKTNIDMLRASLQLRDSELLALLEGSGAEILDLSNEYLKRNFKSLNQRMASLGCRKADLKKLILSYPIVLYIGPDTLNTKLDCLLSGGITMKQILEKPKVLDYSTQNITGRLGELQRLGYDFQKSGINILDSSRKRFDAKMGKLNASPDD
ncbi:transcription termination factor 1, mitochondrial [Cyclopterus lumpus]|uniref:Mitochondrial transcription termination factor 1 n=1 Tax=Cyclopterus lumpus TaxID=8103 RepID=A0A8C2WEP5_CYCLU|nr:transcription termination factor 1, mitochondrial [Cyclopterus lumpus]XP_034401993.1 transcription termination factor 1, mitochondrial [Cyclopterus lumpus]XP_034401994.1 transcription termination factor 1, mitochondrial [Cyclopterus lumpus]XP_034401995.1 transcription termination factor 1, mitochondrial [Cyclopterus lumpus]XP_034401996.1 transcription termination factor 1, mitochondrial [Cyclopterus lumpus]XP_034401997.1 transcription termination factor 1, mitochondrial [Cyclopterus lumpus]